MPNNRNKTRPQVKEILPKIDRCHAQTTIQCSEEESSRKLCYERCAIVPQNNGGFKSSKFISTCSNRCDIKKKLRLPLLLCTSFKRSQESKHCLFPADNVVSNSSIDRLLTGSKIDLKQSWLKQKKVCLHILSVFKPFTNSESLFSIISVIFKKFDYNDQ